MVTVNTGTSGSLHILDNGSVVTFQVSNRQGATYVNGATWSGYIGGAGVSGSFNINGVMTATLGSWGVGNSMNVGFTMNKTGTSGLGGPTSISAYIGRSTTPPAPTTPLIVPGHNSARITFSSQGDGGTPVREWQLGYGSNPNAAEKYIGSSGTSEVFDLDLGVPIYAWARGRNDHGWSPWSGRGSARTLAGSLLKVEGVWKEAVAYIKVDGVWKQAIPYVKKNGLWLPSQ